VRKITYPPNNTLAAYTFDASYTITPAATCAADGKPVGADVAGILAAIPGLDLSK